MLFVGLTGNAGAEVDCTGTVDNLSLHLNDAGTVTLSLSGGSSFTYLCNIEGATGVAGLNGVSGRVCTMMYSTSGAASHHVAHVSLQSESPYKPVVHFS